MMHQYGFDRSPSDNEPLGDWDYRVMLSLFGEVRTGLDVPSSWNNAYLYLLLALAVQTFGALSCPRLHRQLTPAGVGPLEAGVVRAVAAASLQPTHPDAPGMPFRCTRDVLAATETPFLLPGVHTLRRSSTFVGRGRRLRVNSRPSRRICCEQARLHPRVEGMVPVSPLITHGGRHRCCGMAWHAGAPASDEDYAPQHRQPLKRRRPLDGCAVLETRCRIA